MVIPPPDVTGQLHMGHALDDTLQDIIIRAKRMEGCNTLWVPGTDHAGIATQIKVEEVLRREKGLIPPRYRTRGIFGACLGHGRQSTADRIISQLKKLGASCDWDARGVSPWTRVCSAAVQGRPSCNALRTRGLSTAALRITNWCPHCTHRALRCRGGVRRA